MKTFEINLGKKKPQAKIFSFIDEIELFKDKEKFSEKFASYVKENQGGFAGWNSREDLIEFLKYWFYSDNDFSFTYSKISHKEIEDLVKQTLNYLSETLSNEKLKIFVLPNFSEFKIQKMGGLGGLSLGKGVVYTDIFPKKGWKKNFGGMLTHEIAHAVSPFYNPLDMSVGEQIIFDGIAEHFREKFSNSRRSPWTKAISKEKALQIFSEIKENLDVRDFDYCSEIFYGNGRYPLWAGYTMGYYLIQDYIKNKRVDWNKLIN